MPHSYDAVRLFDLGYGPRLVPVCPPGCDIAPGSKIRDKDRGKAPAYLTTHGWTGASVNEPKHRCADFFTAKLWDFQWGANIGLVAGDGLTVIDNDQGEEFSHALREVFPRALRRFVADPKHKRDAFLVRVVDGDTMGPEVVANASLRFKKGLASTEVQVLAKSKMAVIGGVHPGTKSPYVWEEELPPYDQIPAMTLPQFAEGIRKFVVLVHEAGWAPVKPAPVSAPVSANSAVAVIPPLNTQATLGHNRPPSDKIDEARELLAQIPNREVPAGEAPNAIDDWLDAYMNWIDVGYRLAAFAPAQVNSPEMRDAWATWSDGRAQPGQTSASVWDSIALNPPTKYGEMALYELVRQFRDAPKPDFPELDPSEFPPDPPKSPPRGAPLWDALSHRWAYSKAKGFVDMATGRVCDRTKFSDGEAYKARALCRELGIRFRAKPPSVADIFLGQPGRIEVFDVTYAPGDQPFVASLDPDMASFNRWKPSGILPEVVEPSRIQIWLDHLTFVLGTPQERDRFLKWCAFVVQNPELKPNWHFLVISDSGLGKDTMTLPLKLAVGIGNAIDILSYALSGDFNPWAEHKLIIVGETVQVSTPFASASEVNNRLKPLLAQPPAELTINRKNQQQYTIPNRCAVVLFSNAANPLYLERKSRRVHVVNRLGADARDQPYYEGVHQWLEKGGAELCAAYLLNLALTEAERREFKGGVAPATDDKAELEDQNLHPQQALLEALVRDARDGITSDTPYNLVATADELRDYLKLKSNHAPSAQAISGFLLGMERNNTGVRRLKIDPASPRRCGVISARINGVKYLGRLWALADKTADGRAWGALSETEIVAIWKNLTTPKSATVSPIRSKVAGDFEDPV